MNNGNLRSLRLCVSAVLVFVAFPCALQAAWWIDSYRTDFTVKKDGTLVVNERIGANFTEEPHHGIYRDIPLRFTDGTGRRMNYRFRILFVDDGEGRPYPYRTSWSGGTVRVKVGDPNKTWQDVRPYRIVYEVRRWCLGFPDRQELYWNAIGTGWAVPIREASATVELPEGIDPAKVRTASFSGAAGRQGTDAASGFEDGLFRFRMTRALEPFEAMTVAVTWPGRPVPVPGFWQEALWTLQDNAVLLIPLLAFVYLFWRWWKVGRDPKGREAIAVMYHPPEGLSAAEAGALMDERVDMRDITAAIVELATRGYLVIREEEQKGFLFKKPDFTLVKTPERNWGALSDPQRHLLERLFEGRSEVGLSDLDTAFYRHLPGIRAHIYKSLVDQGHFSRNPDSVRNIHVGIGFVFIILGTISVTVLSAVSRGEPDPMAILGMIVTGVLVIAFGSVMPARTKKGVLAREHLLGLEEYIRRAEKDTLALQERQNVFEEILPYAMALGMASKWSNVFSGIFREPPTWYRSHSPYAGWSAQHFHHRLSAACSSLGTSMASTPRSSGGGGFGGGGGSGGGGGGGGGGAW
jgi:uncharacterized membrane protein YgcG